MFSPPSFASSFERIAPEKFVSEAPILVRGVTGKSHSDWGKDNSNQRKIFTFTDFEVQEVLKGKVSQNRIVLQELGGEADGVGLQIEGAAQFNPDENIIIALAPTPTEGTYRVYGMTLGKITIDDPSNPKSSLQGLLVSQNPIDLGELKRIIKNPTQEKPITTLSVAPGAVPTPEVVEKDENSSFSAVLVALLLLIIISAGTWMISRKK